MSGEREMRYIQALRDALQLEMRRDSSVFVVGEDVRHSLRGITRGLVDDFGEDRVLDMPISEAAFTGFATGASMAGMRPVVEYQIPSLAYTSFDQLVDQALKLPLMMGGQTKIPVTYLFAASGWRPGLAGQHSDHPYPYLMHAGMKTVIPSTPVDAKGLLLAAIRDDDPVAVFAPAASLPVKGPVPEGDFQIPLGVGEVKREGSDVTVVATGHLVRYALAAADQLEAEDGISVEVYDPRTLLPLDRKTLLESVKKTKRVVVFDDSNRTCGFSAEASALLADIAFDYLRAPVKRVARATMAVPFSKALEDEVLPTTSSLLDTVRSLAAVGVDHG